MNKKLLAIAVAGALAAPGLAFAQATSVTISGVLKVGVDNLSISSPNNGPAGITGRAGKNTSEMRVTDNSSRILLNMVEDLGNGLAAIGQVDLRFSTDIGSNATAATNATVGASTMGASGNTWVGLRSKSIGSVVFGRSDLHYGTQPDDIATKAGALMATSISLFDYIGQTAIAGGTRTNNVVKYDSPNWGGFEVTAAWSANATGAEADLVNSSNNAVSNTTRKGNAWNLKPRYTAGNWGAGWSHWEQKSDGGTNPGATATTGITPEDQRGDTLYGYVAFGGLKAGVGFNKSRLTSTDGSNTPVGFTVGAITNSRTAWTIPVSYTFGPNNIYFHYTKANADKNSLLGDDGAKMVALAYVYEFSKRTSVGVTYAKIKNDPNATYSFFTNNSNGVFGSGGSASLAGEAPQLIQLTMRHAF